MAVLIGFLLLCSAAFALPSQQLDFQPSMAETHSISSTGLSPIVERTTSQENSIRSITTAARWLPITETVRGVNLGSQFIIEPWMTYDDFNAMGCGEMQDETSCVSKLGQETADAVFAKHWDTWTTQDDIAKIASLGLNVIRIPVGFWIREDLVHPWEHFPRGGLPYLDRLAGWAADAGLYVIIDLHGAPGSQAQDQQFTGYKTMSPGFYNVYNYERAVQFLEWMANRIHTRQEYRTAGILQVLNEPVSQTSFPNETADMIQNFYPLAYDRIRAAEESVGVGIEQQLKVQYMSRNWGSGNPSRWLPDSVTNVLFDDHRYYAYGDNAPMTGGDALDAAYENNGGGNRVIVGEWSLSLKDGIVDPVADKEWYKSFWQAQVQSYGQTGGWIFWTWKCNWIGGRDEWRWCYQSAVDNGVIPGNVSTNVAASHDLCS